MKVEFDEQVEFDESKRVRQGPVTQAIFDRLKDDQELFPPDDSV